MLIYHIFFFTVYTFESNFLKPSFLIVTCHNNPAEEVSELPLTKAVVFTAYLMSSKVGLFNESEWFYISAEQ